MTLLFNQSRKGDILSTYLEIVSQIENLKKQADHARKNEVAATIKEIKRLISVFDLTASDLGLDLKRQAGGSKGLGGTKSTLGASSKRRVKKTDRRKTVPPKYRDENGNTWTGRGKSPRWVSLALESGKSLESLLIER